MLLPLLYCAPWLAVFGFLVFRVRMPRPLPGASTADNRVVSVVVPARNEAQNIEACVSSLVASTYPRFEVVVVDDRSDDATGDLVRALRRGRAERVVVVEGAHLPDGWLGKPWACRQGAEAAAGDLLLFTDADTVHGPELLGRAVAAMDEDEADLLTLSGRQIMGSFWERLVQPQIFLSMLFRFYDMERATKRGRWRDAIANGQFMLFPRESYDALGGHGSVRDEIVEDLAMAQHVVREGRRLSLRQADQDFATRMYRSLSELVAGWSKNLMMGGAQSMPPLLRPLVAPFTVLMGAGLWLAPPIALAAALMGVGGAGLLTWAAATVGISAVFWMVFTARMGAPFGYGLLYPLGSVVAIHILLRSWARGRKVEWKGREYTLKPVSEVR